MNKNTKKTTPISTLFTDDKSGKKTVKEVPTVKGYKIAYIADPNYNINYIKKYLLD